MEQQDKLNELLSEGWSEKISERDMMKVMAFVMEDDEVFFRRITSGLTDAEIEEYLQDFPEFRKYWKKNKEDQKDQNLKAGTNMEDETGTEEE